MSNAMNDAIDVDDLDYELEMEIDEENLLESEEDTPDTGLPLTKVVPTVPTQPTRTLLPPLIRLTNVECPTRPSTIFSFEDNLDSPTKPVNEAAEPENTTETAFGFEHVKSALIAENITSIDTSEPKSPQRQSQIHSTEMKKSKIPDITSSSPSSPSTSLSTSKKQKQKTGMLTISAGSKRRVVVPSLLAINTMGPALSGQVSTVDHRMDSDPNAPKKNRFIIRAQSIGTAVSRTVLVDPTLDGFTNNLDCKVVRNASRTYSGDLRRSLLVKRKVVTISNVEEAKTEPPPSAVNEESLSEVDKIYISEIEKQKLKRKKFLQMKEVKSREWKFVEN